VKSIGFGDIREAYVIRDVSDFALLRLNERYADYLQVGFLGFQRSDGTLQNAERLQGAAAGLTHGRGRVTPARRAPQHHPLGTTHQEGASDMAEASRRPPARSNEHRRPDHGDHDRVQMLSLKADGTPDQHNPEIIGDKDVALEAAKEQFKQQAVSAADVRTPARRRHDRRGRSAGPDHRGRGQGAREGRRRRPRRRPRRPSTASTRADPDALPPAVLVSGAAALTNDDQEVTCGYRRSEPPRRGERRRPDRARTPSSTTASASQTNCCKQYAGADYKTDHPDRLSPRRRGWRWRSSSSTSARRPTAC
jgi:hypothetical protein